MKPFRPGRSFSYYKIYKPFGMLSQFSDSVGRATLKELGPFPRDVYSVGRLDMDSEGLLLLTNDRRIPDALLNPKNAHERTYLVLVEGIPPLESIVKLTEGVVIEGILTLPARAEILTSPPDFPERTPAVRGRKNITNTWISLTLREGRNRQVRKMTAAVGHPTLRLIRTDISGIKLGTMKPGEVLQLSADELDELYNICKIKV